ncbi:hypothetical protein [Kitasatospora sp. NPDC090091]|uniref:hypothetical protein n=1 Tax=Kitasatospora sp. NPDC090091 TaxID=3364081 RepID=UPI0037F36F13
MSTTPAPKRPASVLHSYERGITADLLHEVGGYPGLHEEARTELADEHPCRRENPDADLPLTVTSDEAGYLTVRAEIPCTDLRCRTEAAAVARYQELQDAFDRAQEYMAAANLLLQQPNLADTPDPAQLSKLWTRREHAIREALRTVIDTITPHAEPAPESAAITTQQPYHKEEFA